MSLNSWVTKDGEEIGIAQAVQAWAAKTEPSADMNPVLLKPKGDMTSQVIVHGKPVGDKQVGEYYDSVDVIFEDICHSLKALASSYEVIVIEGAGSPAEINLWERDIANFRIARSVDAPVILVGDIERGGVFASLYGTIKLLPVDDRRRIRGIIINKFRGEEKLLESGLKQLERLTSIPILGVIPFMNVRLPSEDSVSLGDKLPSSHHELEIAVIRLPHISNFTDFEPLEAVARIRYVALESDLGSPHVVIIPGTKNTIDDLTAMRRSGMDRQIIEKAGTIPIIGICGGFQMLGESLIDEGLESVKNEQKAFEGLKLLHVTTVFNSREKQTKQVEKSVTGNGPLLDSLRGQTIRGYEIHMGTTASGSPIFGDDGAQDDAGLILGTYLHGLFHNDNFRAAFLSYLRSKHQSEQQEVYKSSFLVCTPPNSSQPETKTDPYDELASAVREHLDVEALYSIIGL
jgi:adenosylcobyric acid synthase